MNHVKDEQIQAFITNGLTEAQRTDLEEHLFSCDLCLEHYMQWIEVYEHHLPNLDNNDEFIDGILAGLSAEHLPSNSMDQSRVEPTLLLSKRLRPFFHYAIAASITLLLMSSGVFQGMTGLASTIDEAPKQERSSLSQSIMDHALQWFDFKLLSPKEDEQ